MEQNNRVDGFMEHPRRSLFKLAAPVIIGQLAFTLYSAVDTIYVGRLGPEAIAAITLCFPLFFIMNAFAFGTGLGITQVVGRYVGARKKREAENSALHGILLNGAFGVIFMAIGLLFISKVFLLFRADPAVMAYGVSYMRIMYLGAPLFFVSIALYSILPGEGDTKTPTMIQIISVIMNIILDPIFIFTLGMGVPGAAIATICAQAIGLLIFLIRYIHLNTGYLQLTRKSFTYSRDIFRKILKVGFPVTLMQLTMSLGLGLLNIVLAGFGTMVIAGFGLAARLDSFVILPVIGFSSALVSMVAMFHGAKRPDLIRRIAWFGIKANLLAASILGLVFFIFSPLILRAFTDDPVLIELGVEFFRYFAFTYPFMAVSITAGRIIQGLGHGLPGLIIIVVRVIAVAIPLAYLFVGILGYGYQSVLVALIISSIASTMIAIPWLRHHLRMPTPVQE